MIDKTVEDTAAVVSGIRDGAAVMIGGFGRSGQPVELIDAHQAHRQVVARAPLDTFSFKSCVLRRGGVSQCSEDRAASRSVWMIGQRVERVRERGVGRDHPCELQRGLAVSAAASLGGLCCRHDYRDGIAPRTDW